MSMKFGLESRDKMVHHWMLNDSAAIQQIVETEDWKNNKSLTAKVTVNGVELDFNVIENYFMKIYNSLEKEIKKNYQNEEAEISRRVEERLKNEAQPILDKMQELRQTLEDAGNIIKPYWE